MSASDWAYLEAICFLGRGFLPHQAELPTMCSLDLSAAKKRSFIVLPRSREYQRKVYFCGGGGGVSFIFDVEILVNCDVYSEKSFQMIHYGRHKMQNVKK
jgi:hypothetical protein